MKSISLSALIVTTLAAPLAAQADSGDRALNATFAQWDQQARAVAVSKQTTRSALAADSYPGTVWQLAPSKVPSAPQLAAPMPAPLAASVYHGA